ncbi:MULTISPECIES: metalloregulator ArsR/SmtB family transcription factor [unclassified Streptomyces]|uniref:ArsR/SmtB family transcription factor n=1 Tax=unclassified Streptomyces TaxID=2593676 RepID=UPI002254B9B8|nr:metalloregulator ArsR/SmtB family transcription factor [Streptomyces sp. NBC_00687]MCX4918432.1 metalloregulator ArsR/SmtB family transcription factor [Streptomyces sp. NBC_00687]
MDADAVFKALADPSRRRLLDLLHERSGLTLNELCDGLDMRRQSVSQHVQLLEAANLVTSFRDGRRKLHFLNPVPIREIQNRWIWKFEDPHLATLDTIKRRAQEHAMTSPNTGTVPDYVYTTYIRATAEQVWHALTDPELTSRFWGHAQVSDWTVGSRVDHLRSDGSGISDAAGSVLEVDRPRRLSFTFGEPARADDPTSELSVVTFEIDSHRDIVKLTVTHGRLSSTDERRAIGEGWPSVLANLKTLLETGDVLPQAPWEFHADERAARMAENG